MRRAHRERGLARRRQRQHLRDVHGWPRKPIACVCDTQAGRFRKRRAHGCTRSHCYLCHGEKYLQVPRHRERKAEARFREQVQEYLRAVEERG
jgi:hypothetical protein